MYVEEEAAVCGGGGGGGGEGTYSIVLRLRLGFRVQGLGFWVLGFGLGFRV